MSSSRELFLKIGNIFAVYMHISSAVSVWKNSGGGYDFTKQGSSWRNHPLHYPSHLMDAS